MSAGVARRLLSLSCAGHGTRAGRAWDREEQRASAIAFPTRPEGAITSGIGSVISLGASADCFRVCLVLPPKNSVVRRDGQRCTLQQPSKRFSISACCVNNGLDSEPATCTTHDARQLCCLQRARFHQCRNRRAYLALAAATLAIFGPRMVENSTAPNFPGPLVNLGSHPLISRPRAAFPSSRSSRDQCPSNAAERKAHFADVSKRNHGASGGDEVAFIPSSGPASGERPSRPSEAQPPSRPARSDGGP